MIQNVSRWYKQILGSSLFLLLVACSYNEQTTESKTDTLTAAQKTVTPAPTDTATRVATPDTSKQLPSTSPALLTQAQRDALPDSAFVDLLSLDSTFVLDMRYATDSNFLKAKVYDCDQCLLRAVVAKALVNVQQSLKEKGYRIKLYDCYRPLDIQKRMWKIMPDDRYVGNPYGNGSIHNKGAAVDLTLVDAQGQELDMGTGFDHFGREAHHAYKNLPAQVLENRKLLKESMENAGFLPITSEWWHYFYKNNGYSVANFKPSC
ncbi:M15 family metallopeptidase [Rhodocytophaga aerolata]|uniref:D-alanyl-D-alanine dipeptidase n=1 Tax=Rhodocytophaga aerolata TaxID=455078 RepID=A0ABT8QY50_9BACT|nr:M15 family metallopeptidase [Rhodocytophaga aerolata]MDO1444765.1 M15 family metallopeptidase [Rhodocytophaga aerolata]